MKRILDGNAVVYCEGAFDGPNGKTAHGLVRRTERYRVVAVIDSCLAGKDAGAVLDGKHRGIPLVSTLKEARAVGEESGSPVTHFVVGLAPDGGRLPRPGRSAIMEAIAAGLHVDSGLHDFLSEDDEIANLAWEREVEIRDVRKTPPREKLHFFSGKIDDVESFRIAMLGTDSAVGKRTTAWLLVDALREAGHPAELVGTGQTAWMQGAPHGIVLDSLINDFVSGEIEHAVWSTWKDTGPDAIVIEGQGSLMNPAYPGGFEILAAGRPHVVVMQHAPGRKEYDGFPGYPIHPLEHQIRAVETVSGVEVVAVTVNHENLTPEEVRKTCGLIERELGLPALEPLTWGVGPLVGILRSHGLSSPIRRTDP
jgi:uncharacterized NAD-dependent epimerase/dehydratase family protein